MGVILDSTGIFLPSIEVDISATTNDWAPTGLSGAAVIYLRNTSASAISVTGLTGGESGRFIAIVHVGSGQVTLEHDDAGSSASNRFDCANNVDDAMTEGDAAAFIYTTTTWKQCGAT